MMSTSFLRPLASAPILLTFTTPLPAAQATAIADCPSDAGSASRVAASAVQVEAGDAYTCAVTSDGAAKCWGSNFSGQLGDGTTQASNIPVDVSGLGSGVVVLAAGADHTCAVMRNGTPTGGRQVLGGEPLRSTGRRHDEPSHAGGGEWAGGGCGGGERGHGA